MSAIWLQIIGPKMQLELRMKLNYSRQIADIQLFKVNKCW